MHQNVLDQEVGISRTLMAASAWKGINVPYSLVVAVGGDGGAPRRRPTPPPQNPKLQPVDVMTCKSSIMHEGTLRAME